MTPSTVEYAVSLPRPLKDGYDGEPWNSSFREETWEPGHSFLQYKDVCYVVGCYGEEPQNARTTKLMFKTPEHVHSNGDATWFEVWG